MEIIFVDSGVMIYLVSSLLQSLSMSPKLFLFVDLESFGYTPSEVECLTPLIHTAVAGDLDVDSRTELGREGL